MVSFDTVKGQTTKMSQRKNKPSVGQFANKRTVLNHEWNITGNYAVRMHETLKH